MAVIGNRLLLANRARLAFASTTRLLSQKSLTHSFTPVVSSKLLAAQTPLSSSSYLKKNYSTDKEDLKKKFDELVKDKDIVVFMKGTPEQPLCGFSRAVCQILMAHGAKFDAYNCLEDESLRQGIKEYTEWPTIPQVFFKGEFIGGCDILLEMHRSGDIIDELAAIGIKSKLAEPEEKK